MYVNGWTVFLFFKQKTAYEMRISDWSSDVCSSDLVLTWFAQFATFGHPVHLSNPLIDDVAYFMWRFGFSGSLFWWVDDNLSTGREKIGRASCRERVCK